MTRLYSATAAEVPGHSNRGVAMVAEGGGEEGEGLKLRCGGGKRSYVACRRLRERLFALTGSDGMLEYFVP